MSSEFLLACKDFERAASAVIEKWNKNSVTRRPALTGRVPFLSSASAAPSFLPINNDVPFPQDCIVSKFAPGKLIKPKLRRLPTSTFYNYDLKYLQIFKKRVKFRSTLTEERFKVSCRRRKRRCFTSGLSSSKPLKINQKSATTHVFRIL